MAAGAGAVVGRSDSPAVMVGEAVETGTSGSDFVVDLRRSFCAAFSSALRSLSSSLSCSIVAY